MPTSIKQKLFGDNEHKRELVEKSVLSFALRVLDLGLGYVAIGLVTNLYGAKAYGVLALSLTALNIAVLVPTFGLNGALVKIVGGLVSNGKSVWPTVKWALLFSGILALIFSAILYGLSPFIAENLLGKVGMTAPLRTISLAVLPLTLTGIVIGILRGYKRTNVSSALPMVTRILIIIALLLSRGNFDLVSLQTMCIALAGLLVMFWFVRDQERKAGAVVDSTKILKLAFPMLLTSSFALLMTWVDVLMIGSMMQEEDVGLYAVAVRLATLTSLGLVAVNTIAGPMIVESYTKGDMKRFEQVVRNSARMIVLVSLPVLGILLLFPKYVLSIFGPEFLAAKVALMWLVLGQFVNSLCGSVGIVLQMTGGERVVMWIMIGAAALNVGLNVLLIPVWGIEGGAVASMCSVAAWNIGMLIAVKARLGFWVVGLK